MSTTKKLHASKQKPPKTPTLTDPGGMGGLIALGGFDYQIWDAIVRVPAWLMVAGFESVMVEGQEDVEARFFAPHAPKQHVLERYQAKTSELTKSELVEVMHKFESLEKSFPRITRRYVLVTPSLAKAFRWLGSHKDRVARCRPFYKPFATIKQANDAQLMARYQDAFGADLGAFASSCVDVEVVVYPTRDQAIAQFGHALQTAFGGDGFLPGRTQKAFESLFTQLQAKRGSHVDRQALIGILQADLGDLPAAVTSPTLVVKLLHAESDATSAVIELDASPFTLGCQGIPAPSVWANELLQPMANLAEWARDGLRQQIELLGSYRLTSAFAAGFSFRSAIGFELSFYNRQVRWETSTHPDLGTPSLQWAKTLPTGLHNGRLLVVLGIVRDPLPAMMSTYDCNVKAATLSLQLDVGITDSKAAQMGVAQVKRAIDEAVTRLRPIGIDLYYVGPAAFAVALGHRWNKMPSTQLYEYDSVSGIYRPTAVLE